MSEAQGQDEQFVKISNEVRNDSRTDFSLKDNKILMLGEILCVPNEEKLKREIVEEAHCSAYLMHPGRTKMYRTLRENYWW